MGGGFRAAKLHRTLRKICSAQPQTVRFQRRHHFGPGPRPCSNGRGWAPKDVLANGLRNGIRCTHDIVLQAATRLLEPPLNKQYMWVWSKLTHQDMDHRLNRPCFHLPGFNFGYLFLTHSHVLCRLKLAVYTGLHGATQRSFQRPRRTPSRAQFLKTTFDILRREAFSALRVCDTGCSNASQKRGSRYA